VFDLYARCVVPWHLLGWIALVPWLVVLDHTTSLRSALGAGLAMCVVFVLGFFGWLPGAIQSYTGASWLVSALVLVLLSPVIQLQLVVFALVRHVVRRRGAGFARTALTGACAYVGAEWFTPKLFGDTLGYGFHPSSLMRQAADLAGPHGLTFVLVLANEGVLATLGALRTQASWRDAAVPAATVAALALALLAYGTVRTRQLAAAPAERPITAGIVQADVARYDRLRAERGTYEAVRAILDAHFALSDEARRRARLDLLVWPETVYPTTFGAPKSEEGAAFDREIGAFVSAGNVPLVFGSYDAEGDGEFNAAVFLEPVTGGRLTFDTYRKASLFPLTERVPALVDTPALRRWLPWLGRWKPGTGGEVVALHLPDGRAIRTAPLICYDAVDPAFARAAVRKGAEVIVTLSNDSWFDEGPGLRLHLVVSAFRSIETRRPQLRATNTGISAVISATGELLATAPVHDRTTLVATVAPVRNASTLVLAWGDWFRPTALALAAVLLVLPRPSRPRAGRAASRRAAGR
jgi:apolipoprotein N-acyltransferase